MAVYQFSALSDGQAISFNATVDRLNFDQTAIAAGDLSLVQEGANLHVIVKSGTVAGKDIFLNGTTLEQIAATNLTFVDGSVARVGDNAVGTTGDAAANVIAGGAGRDLLMGLGGNDNLQAGDNNDSLVGGTGNDTLSGNNGNDWMEGGAGNDTLNGGSGQDTFILREQGAANADSLGDFASGWDRIELDAAALTAIGAQGRFAAGDARFFAGTAAHDADDRIIYNSATGQIFYDADGNGAGVAQLIATLPAGRGVVAGDFNVIGTPGSGGGSTINGTPGNDTLVGTDGNDTINGLGGDDSLDGAFGADWLDGGAGNDYLFGGSDVDRVGEGADILVGGDGNDTLDGWSISNSTTPDSNIETLDGGLGNDVFNVDNPADVLRDAGGTDLVQARTGDWTLAAGFENLILFDQEDGTNEGIGNELDNVMESRAWEAELQGMGGNDLLTVYELGGRTQILRGGDGNDTLLGSSDTTRTTLDGGAGDDSMVGGSATMTGGDGNDTLVGESGIDLNDMTGGTGADRFVFASADNFTFLRDFASGSDRLVLDGNGFADIDGSGDLAAGDERFYAAAGATAAHDATDRIIFNTSTGDLYYDTDGTGSATAQRISAVTGTLAATDITVINGTASGGSTINGGPGNDTLVGTAGNDTINGLGGNDSIAGLGGADHLSGGDGNDTLNAGSADSPSNPDGAPDTLDGGLGDDVYEVYEPGDTILADPQGTDLVRAINVDWTLGAGLNNLDLVDTFGSALDGIGNELNNVIRSASEGGTLLGLGGNDTLIGRNAQNTVNLEGGDGDDTLIGGWHTDFDGGAGNDLLIASATEDNMIGGAGADIFHFGAPDFDFIQDFASGIDKVRLDGTGFTQIGASGNFSAGDARFFAGADAHDADDRVIWDGSMLWYDPDGTGATAKQSIAFLQAGATLVATDIMVINGTAGGSTINGTAGNDSLVGGSGNDTIFGLDGNDTVLGAAGNDSLSGNGGNDSLAGGTGNDRLTGGGGQDSFVFREFGSTNADAMTDFATNWDRIEVDDAAFTAVGAAGRLASGDARFYAAAGATAGHDADDRFVFNTSAGQLWYDADGSGAGAAQLVATLQTGAPLAATDITII